MRVSRIKQLDHKHFYVLSVLLFLGVVGTYAYALHGIAPEKPSPTAAATSASPPLLGVKMPINSERAARKVAEAQKPDGAVLKVQAVQKSDGLAYQVHFTDGSSVEVLAKDGTVANPDKPLDSPAASQPTTDETTPEETPPANDQPTEQSPQQEPEPTPDSSSTETTPNPEV